MFNISRRRFAQAASLGLMGVSSSAWFQPFAAAAAEGVPSKRKCVLLWMAGGPSQMDTFDLKPGHANGGEFKEIATNAPGLSICEHLPKLAAQGDRLAVIRGLSTKEGDHGRGTYLMRTGQTPTGAVDYPSIGSLISKELAAGDETIPHNVSISPFRALNQQAFGPGFLGPRYAPLTVAAADSFQAAPPTDGSAGRYASLTVDDLTPPASVTSARLARRLKIWSEQQKSFLSQRNSISEQAQNTVYERALRLMQSDFAKAFDLSAEPDSIRDAYGVGRFGQGCLMARRLLEAGASFVEVTLGAGGDNPLGWDTHLDNFTNVKRLCGELDMGWSTLMSELSDRGMLESTTIIWMGEFGRTPKINQNTGRDHFPDAWTCVLAGGGIKGGQAYGRTSDDGMKVEDGKVGVGDVLATLCKATGIDPTKENMSPIGRPFKIAEGTPIEAVLS